MVKMYLSEILHILQLLSVEYRRLQSRAVFFDLRCIVIDIRSASGWPVVYVIYRGFAKPRGLQAM